MPGEIGQAAQCLNERKRALLGELVEIGEADGLAMESDASILLSGFDLDRDEVLRAGANAQQMLIACALRGEPVNLVAQALWVEGLAMGLLIAEAREKGIVGGGHMSHSQRCRCVLVPYVDVRRAPLDSGPVEVAKRLHSLLGRDPAERAADADRHTASPTRRKEAADLFRQICAEHGPWEIAAAIGAPAEIDDLRTISYLFAAAVCESDVRDACVESGRVGFEESLA